MYQIFNNDLKICGTLHLDGKGCKFYGDKRAYAIANDSGKEWSDTLEMYVEYGYPQTEMMQEGYHIGKLFDDGYYYIFRIFNVTDELVGDLHVKRVQCINLAIWDLGKTVCEPQSLEGANVKDAFEALLEKSDWRINHCEYNVGVKDIVLEKTNTAQSYLQQFITDFAVEVRAYVRIGNSQVIEKLIDIEVELGEQSNRNIEYGRNILNITRQMSDDTLYTKLYVYGKEGLSIAAANNGKPFLIDEAANDKYNGGNKYLEGVVVNDAIENINALKSWGQQQLKYYNHPKYNYTIDVGQLNWTPNIGDSVVIKDFEMEPPLLLSSRAIQIEESESNPFDNKVTFGEFVEIKATTPDLIWQMQALAKQAAEENSTYIIKQFTPDGLDFADISEKKQIIIRVYKNGENVTSSIDKAAFIWEKIDANGVHDDAWENSMAGRGNVIDVGYEVVDSVIRCKVDSGVGEPIRFAKEEGAALFATYPTDYTSTVDVYNKRAVQYFNISGNYIYWTQGYSGKYKTPDGIESVQITRTTLSGQFVDMMICKHGGHGSNFGIEVSGTNTYIWMSYINPTSTKYEIARFPYQANAVIDYGHSSIWTYQPFDRFKRVNYDKKSDMIHVTTGTGTDEVTLYACTKADILSRKWLPKYTMKLKDYGFDASTQTFQSSYLDFPYVYVTSGDMVGTDNRMLYCFDIVSQSLVYKIAYNFSTIKKIGSYDEPEGVFVYDDGTSRKLLQSFAFGNEIEDTGNTSRLNQIYEIKETIKG